MTSSDLRALGLAVWGREWQSPLARAIGVSPRTVRRWASGDVPVPERVEAEIRRVIGADETTAARWPRDEWIVQREEGRRTYVVHTLTPRFIARQVICDGDGRPLAEEGAADVTTGIVYADDDVLCEIVWIDPPPAEREILALMDAACDALEDD